jgi:DNA-binding NarL/FixJ family response regulator
MAELLLDLRSIYPELKVIALSGRPEARRSALEAHVDGFISKGDPPECVLTTLDVMTDTIKQRCMPV